MPDILGSAGQSIVEVALAAGAPGVAGKVEGLGTVGGAVGGVLTVQGFATTILGMAGGSSNPIPISGTRLNFPNEAIVPSADVDSVYGDSLNPSSVVAFGGIGLSRLYDGSFWKRARTPTIFKPQLAVVITGETTIWTPAAGKKFRLMGFVITQGVLTGNVTLRDNTAGATILVIPATPIGQSLYVPIGNGILSAAANNVLTAQGAAGETLSGFVFGTEE